MNFKRKHPKKHWYSTCGHKHCIQDCVHDVTHNGRDRYLPSYWRKFGGSHVWRYTRKNVSPDDEIAQQ